MGFKERDVKRKRSAIQDKVVAAVLSRASNVKRLVTDFTEEVGDPQDSELEGGPVFPEIASGGFVSRKDLKLIYEDYDDLEPLEGRVSASCMKALEEGAALTSTEKALLTKQKLAAYFAEPVEGAGYVIVAVTSSSGRTVYWTEIREGCSWEGIEREILGIFPSVAAAKAALRRKGLISARDYRPRHHARRGKGRM